MTAELFPVSLRLQGRRCLVVGGGQAALDRAERLRAAGAQVTVIVPAEDPGSLPGVNVEKRAFRADDLDGCRLAVLVDRDAAAAATLAAECALRNVLFCAVDQPEYGDFSHVAVLRRGSLVLTVSTEGRVPGLAQRLRDELGRLLGAADLEGFLGELEAIREKVSGAARQRAIAEAAARLSVEGTVTIRKKSHSNSGNPSSGSGAG